MFLCLCNSTLICSFHPALLLILVIVLFSLLIRALLSSKVFIFLEIDYLLQLFTPERLCMQLQLVFLPIKLFVIAFLCVFYGSK